MNTCSNLIRELRLYHRNNEGKIVKNYDHCCDALRYGIMGRHLAAVEPDYDNKDKYIYSDQGRDLITGM